MTHEIDLQVACTPTELPTKEQFQLWVDTALAEVSSEPKQEFELTIRLVNNEESQQLNMQYRGKDKPTNVLSFPFEVPEGVELNLLGDLIICIEVMKQEAQEQNKALFDHWAHLVIHGCLPQPPKRLVLYILTLKKALFVQKSLATMTSLSSMVSLALKKLVNGA